MISDALTSIFVRAYLVIKNEEGQTFVEYSLIGLLVAVVVAGVMAAFTGKITGALTSIENAF
jgi:Flp pilus assembly pilin Flp